MKSTALLKRLCKDGIPTSIRGKVWPLLLGNQLRITADIYDLNCKRADCVRALLTSSRHKGAEELNRIEGKILASSVTTHVSTAVSSVLQSEDNSDTKYYYQYGAKQSFTFIDKEESLMLISLDIPRTLSSTSFFCSDSGCGVGERASRVLSAFACYRPDIGYVQGMSYLSVALSQFMDELTAFKCFCNLIYSKRICFDFYRLDPWTINVYMGVFNVFLQRHLPGLQRHFATVGIRSEVFLMDWIMSLFLRAMPLFVALRVWDVCLLEGDEVVICISLGILQMYCATLLTIHTMEDIIMLLCKLPLDMDADCLLDHISSMMGAISRDDYVSVLGRMRHQIRPGTASSLVSTSKSKTSLEVMSTSLSCTGDDNDFIFCGLSSLAAFSIFKT